MTNNKELNIEDWKSAEAFHDKRLEYLLRAQFDLTKKLDKWHNDLNHQKKILASMVPKKEDPTSTIYCHIDVKETGQTTALLRYFTAGASWIPSYDFKLSSIDEPIIGTYKATISQQTREDWNNVKLTLSTSNPRKTSVIPHLKKYALAYNTQPPKYEHQSTINGTLEGVVVDEEGVPLIGANVVIKNTTIGTITNFDGHFNLAIPPKGGDIEVSYVGYNTAIYPINKTPAKVVLKEGKLLDEIVIRGSRSGAAYYIDGIKSLGTIESKAKPKKKLPIIQKNLIKQGIRSFTYTLEKPYSLASESKPITVNVLVDEIDFDYRYNAIPKIEETAFLQTEITNLFEGKVLDGEANLYYNNNYLGQTVIQTKVVEDTIGLSFGRDLNIVVKRSNLKKKSKTKWLKNTKAQTLAYSIKVHNKKDTKVKVRLQDQFPVSEVEDIKVELLETAEAQVIEDLGWLIWDIALNPDEQKEFIFSYKVTSPKSSNLVIN